MSKNSEIHLSRRERQIMDIIYRKGQASAAEVQGNLPDPPSYSAVRALMRILEEKGYLKHERDCRRYVYSPTRSLSRAGKSAVQRILRTFFNSSAEKAVTAILDVSDLELPPSELKRLEQMIRKAKRKDGKS